MVELLERLAARATKTAYDAGWLPAHGFEAPHRGFSTRADKPRERAALGDAHVLAVVSREKHLPTRVGPTSHLFRLGRSTDSTESTSSNQC